MTAKIVAKTLVLMFQFFAYTSVKTLKLNVRLGQTQRWINVKPSQPLQRDTRTSTGTDHVSNCPD